jgi:hypothetical protein
MAIQTLTSGKQIIEVKVGKIQRSPWLEMNQGQFERTSAPRNLWRLVELVLDRIDDNLFQGYAARSGSGFGPPEKRIRHVDRGSHYDFTIA